MVNQDKLDGMFRNLEAYLTQLRDLAKAEPDEFLSDGTKIGAARYYLQIAIETCINIGNHIISAENLRPPDDYRDVFTVLNESGIVPDDFRETLYQMVGMRNRLVHVYWKVDDDIIHDTLRNRLGDFETFTRHILRFLEKQDSTDRPSTSDA